MKQINVLLIEDSVYSADLNVREMKRAGFVVQNRTVAGGRAMEEALKDEQWDLILSDNNMPGFSALQAIEVRNRLASLVPFIIISEDISRGDILKAMEEGCCAYLAKKNLNMLGKLVMNTLEYGIR
jgi:DNA-binding NtrC family response regulator